MSEEARGELSTITHTNVCVCVCVHARMRVRVETVVSLLFPSGHFVVDFDPKQADERDR